jgi:hypothetical protein
VAVGVASNTSLYCIKLQRSDRPFVIACIVLAWHLAGHPDDDPAPTPRPPAARQGNDQQGRAISGSTPPAWAVNGQEESGALVTEAGRWITSSTE